MSDGKLFYLGRMEYFQAQRKRQNLARTSWEGETLYLHTDNDPAAFGLYNSSGYVVRKQEKARAVI